VWVEREDGSTELNIRQGEYDERRIIIKSQSSQDALVILNENQELKTKIIDIKIPQTGTK